jgi:chromatin structure-remodeling complex subunit RSC1/2
MDIRAQFHRDQYDRVLFFTAPPLDVPSVPAAKKTLGHSVKYLAKKLRDTAAAAEAAKKKRADSAALAANANSSSEVLKRKQSEEDEEDDLQALKRRALQVFSEQIETGTAGLYKRMFGEEWESVKKAEAEQLKLVQEEQRAKREGIETREALRWAERQVKLS